MKLSPHFSLEEMVFSSTAVARGIDNTPSETVIENLTKVTVALEQIRAVLNFPLHIDSGYRCTELNHLVRGVPNSAHVLGYAADFICPAFGTPLEIVERIMEFPQIKFDQVIQEGTWVHISVDPAMRQQALTAHFVGGVAHYLEGVEA